MGSRADRPDDPRVKLYLAYEQHREFGKAFDENVWRKGLGLPSAESEGRAPLILRESRARAEAVDIGATEAETALREQAEAVGQDAIVRQNMELTERVQQLEEQLREVLNEEPPPPPRPKPEATASEPEAPLAFSGKPELSWTIKQIVDWGEKQGLEMPPKKGFGMTKAAVLEHVLAKATEAEQAQEAAAASAAG